MPANNRSAVSGGLNLSLESLGVNLPYSMEAEQAVLGAAILDADIIPKMVETLRPEMFYARQNGEIFSEIVRLFTGSAPVDFVTLLAAVQDAAVFETEDAAKVYLTQLAETVPSLSHTDTYVKIIAEKYRVRQLMNAAKKHTPEIFKAFPRDTPEEKRLFDLLQRAYIESRYNPDFEITKADIDALLPKIELLHDVVEQVCNERLAYYDSRIEK